MTRRVLLNKKDIWRARQAAYADHFEKRQQASAYSMDQAMRTLKALEQMPEPQLDIRGMLDNWTYNAHRAKPIDEQIQLLRESGTPSELFVKWYWSADEWNRLVQQFNALPEPEPLYEITMDNGHPEIKVVPYIMGTTRGQVRDNPGTTSKLFHRKGNN